MNLVFDCRTKIGMDLRPFHIPNRLLLSAGPTNCSLRVLKALSMQTIGPLDADMLKLLDEVREMLKKVFRTKNRLTFAPQVSGTGGIEMAICSTLEPGQKIIIAIGGIWGERTSIIAKRYKVEVVELHKNPDEVYSFEYLEEEIKKHKPLQLHITHGETSSGVLQPLDGLGKICHKYNCLLVVDAIITIGCDSLLVDDWELDIVIGSTQKAIGAPPGLALLTFSEKAEKVVLEKKSPNPFYLDVKGNGGYWNCFGENHSYIYTYSSNMIAALREALAEKLEEGLENVWARHKMVTEKLWKNMEELGFKHFVPKSEHRLHALNTYILPEGIGIKDLYDRLSTHHYINIGFGIGPTTNKVIRLGLMNQCSSINMIDHLTKAMKESLDFCRNNKK